MLFQRHPALLMANNKIAVLNVGLDKNTCNLCVLKNREVLCQPFCGN